MVQFESLIQRIRTGCERFRTSETVIRMDSNIEFGFPFIIREQYTPHLAKKIFDLLDQETLCKSRAVSRGWQFLVDSSTTFWSDFSSRQIIKAVRDGRMDIIQLFVENAKVPNPPTDTGFTPLHMAARVGHLEIFKMIFDCVLDKNPKDCEGFTPLHMAATVGHLEIFKMIFDCVFDKNPKNFEGVTPLHFAAEYGHPEICRLVIHEVTDKNPRNKFGKTPLYYAALNSSQGCHEVYKLISNYVGNEGIPLQESFEQKSFREFICIFIVLFLQPRSG